MRRASTRALIVGAGISGFLHGLALRAAGVTIVGVVDPDGPRAELLAGLIGGTATTSLAVAQRIEADVAAVCSPPVFHVEQAEALARPGRLVLVEKPVALDDDGLDRLRALPNVVPILQWRAGRAARELRALFASDAFGARPRLSMDLRLWRDDAYFAGGRRGRERWGCGALTSIGIHAIDLVLFAVGRRVVSSVVREHFGRKHVDVATAGEAVIEFEGGASAELRITLDARDTNDVLLVVRGPRGSAALAGDEGDPTANALALRGEPRRVLDAIDDAFGPRDRAARAGSRSGALGATGSPLLVPFVREALEAHAAGRRSVSIDEVSEAHSLAYRAANSRKIASGAG